MTPQEFQRLLEKYTTGNCTPEEKKLVDEWFENIPRPKAEDIDFQQVESGLWARIKPEKQVSSPGHWVLRIAASIALVISAAVGLYYLNSDRGLGQISQYSLLEHSTTDKAWTYSNHETIARKISLEDGSFITLEPGSSVSYPQKFSADKRVVTLSGEAFFQVRPDSGRPFYVYSDEIITKVLGTSFTIKAYASAKEIVVAVKTGKVSVYANPEKQTAVQQKLDDVILTRNQKIVYDRRANSVSKQIVEIPEVVREKTELFEMSFDGKPVTEIFEILEKNYGIDIEYDSETLKNCVLTTKMTEEGFHERIDIICKAINAEYTTTDAVIRITSQGCK
ncbi:MAG TPA: FecR family protein [Chryseosolibacter sp.]|nr:FecR family protein [Chryseosolibacter sp.]